MAKNVVPSSGSPDSRYVIVGARPGVEEVQAGLPFVGPAGRLLWKLAPFSRGECYVCNVRQDFSSTHPTPTRPEIQEALPLLRNEIERTSANIIICLGADAFYALSQLNSLDSWRGSIIESS